jgi:hypothetical protein
MTGMNLRAALQLARERGCMVQRLAGTGEVTITHPTVPFRLRLNARRKDSPRILTVLLRRLEDAVKGETHSRAGRSSRLTERVHE